MSPAQAQTRFSNDVLGRLETQTRAAIQAQAERDLALRSTFGAMVYFLVVIVVVLTTQYGSDHPGIIFSLAGLMFVLGAVRLAAGIALSRSAGEVLFRWTGRFRLLLYAQVCLWGAFCALTVVLYDTEWPTMLVLLSTASLAGGATASFSPDYKLASRCLLGLVMPSVVVCVIDAGTRTLSVAFLASLYLVFLLMQVRQDWSSYWRTSVAVAREATRESDKLFRAVFEDANIGMALLGGRGRFLKVNRALADILGYSEQELLATDLGALASPETRSVVRNDLALLSENNSRLNFERPFIHQQGSTLWASVTVAAVGFEQHHQPYYLAMVQDVTEQRKAKRDKQQMEAQLRQAQKLEAIGVLAGGIAHDFNNILAAIIGFTELAKIEMPDSTQGKENLDEVLKASGRATDLVRHILTFSRQPDQERQLVPIAPLVEETVKLLRASLPVTIEIREQITPHCGSIMANPTEIHQLVMNLCMNAYQAMGDSGGILKVALEPLEVDAAQSARYPDLEQGPYVRLSVGDTGPGIDPATKERMFEPFFTTKPAGAGTGLGLSLVHGIVSSSRGGIVVDSEAGSGTTFQIYLPRFKSTATEKPAQFDSRPTGTEHVLLVDDEESLVRATQALLEQLGYQVTGGTDPVEALHLFSGDPARFDVVISDVTMPKMTGIELASRLLKVRPDLPIILASGYNELITPDEAREMGVRELMMKPVASGELARTVRRVLNLKRRAASAIDGGASGQGSGSP